MNRARVKGLTKKDLQEQDFLNQSELCIYLTGVGDNKVLQMIKTGVFVPVCGVFSRHEVDLKLQNFSQYKPLEFVEGTETEVKQFI